MASEIKNVEVKDEVDTTKLEVDLEKQEELKKQEEEFKVECDKCIKISLSTDKPNEYLVAGVFKQINTNKHGVRLNYTGAHWEDITIGGTWKIVTPVFVKKMFVNELRQVFVRYQSELEELKSQKTGTFVNSSDYKDVVSNIKKIDDILLALWDADFHDRLLKMCEIQLSVNK